MSPEILNLEWELSIRKLLNPWSFVCVNDFLPNPDLFPPEVLDLRSDGTKVADQPGSPIADDRCLPHLITGTEYQFYDGKSHIPEKR